jgi:hypothetical protein
MTLVKVKTLYDSDFVVWIEETVKQLKSGDFSQVDLENLIEEVESLGKKDKRELENSLMTLFEHALKRCYVPLPECYRGWENTLKRTQKELKKILRDSPSLKNYFYEVFVDCYRDGVDNIRDEYDVIFPDDCPFANKIDDLLNREFWKS